MLYLLSFRGGFPPHISPSLLHKRKLMHGPHTFQCDDAGVQVFPFPFTLLELDTDQKPCGHDPSEQHEGTEKVGVILVPSH
jgi:hypothetical protein